MISRCNIVGGGPAGLYLAYLLKRRWIARDVNVLEQNPRDATWGFGVVLAENGLKQFADLDPTSYAAIETVLEPLRNQRIVLNGRTVEIDAPRAGGGVERLALLKVLHALCEGVGVRLVFDYRIEDLATLAECDLLVGADGISSVVRKRWAADFGTSTRELTNRFAWYGVQHAYQTPSLSFVARADEIWVAHFYRYSPSMSTFLVECDAQTWRNSGLEAATLEEQRQIAETVFADELRGAPLINNHSVWRTFTVVQNRNWWHNNVTLLGDALHTIHFSIGSGTRVAMEDSIALAQSLEIEGARVERGLARYQAERQPIADKLAGAAERSFDWYENLRIEMREPDPIRFAYRYLTRTGRVDDQRLAQIAPEFMARYRNHMVNSAPVREVVS
jgi:2-polyprenyl-6-methoxyphenol hydroxylase-like FAD-dependent oxidoreductase